MIKLVFNFTNFFFFALLIILAIMCVQFFFVKILHSTCRGIHTYIWFGSIILGSKIRLVTLDLAMDLVKGMVLGENRSYMTDTHFAELEGIREESTLLLRNFYKVISTPKIFLLFFNFENCFSILPNECSSLCRHRPGHSLCKNEKFSSTTRSVTSYMCEI